jgi:hypothetical protein
MKIPTQFNELATSFFFDGVRSAKSEEDWIGSRVRGLNPGEKVIVRDFLDELLEKKLSGVELRRIWNSTGTDVLFPDDEHLRRFLLMIRNILTSQISE